MRNLAGFFSIICLLCECDSGYTSPAKNSSAAFIKQQSNLPHIATNKKQPIFDVPSLLGLSISQIKSKLGPPVREEQSNASGTQRYCEYVKYNYILTINYKVKTGETDLFFIVNSKEKLTYAALLVNTNLDSLSEKYTTEYSIEPTIRQYPGLLVTAESSVSKE